MLVFQKLPFKKIGYKYLLCLPLFNPQIPTSVPK